MNRKAFTLIELLVVIAIIAILAAILFPVFAQAKESAKDTATLSNVKQTGTSILMYSADDEDTFPLHTRQADGTTASFTTWQIMIQPYMKNNQLYLHPKLPQPTNNNFYQRMSHFALAPRAVSTKRTPDTTQGYFTWSNATVTGGNTVRFDGVAGAGADASASIFQIKDAASLTTSGIANPSDQVMVTEAGRWDMGWSTSPFTPMTGCETWNTAENNVNGRGHYRGPHSMKRGTQTGRDGGCFIPNGRTTFVATDSSAKSLAFRGALMSRTEPSTGVFIHPRFWPQGN